MHWKKLFCDDLHRAFELKEAVRTDESIEVVLPDITQAVTAKWKAFQRKGKKKRAGTNITVPDEPGARTLLRWFWDYEDAGFRIEGLRSCISESGNYTQRFEPGVVALLTKCIQEYATRRRKNQGPAANLSAFQAEDWLAAGSAGFSVASQGEEAFRAVLTDLQRRQGVPSGGPSVGWCFFVSKRDT